MSSQPRTDFKFANSHSRSGKNSANMSFLQRQETKWVTDIVNKVDGLKIESTHLRRECEQLKVYILKLKNFIGKSKEKYNANMLKLPRLDREKLALERRDFETDKIIQSLTSSINHLEIHKKNLQVKLCEEKKRNEVRRKRSKDVMDFCYNKMYKCGLLKPSTTVPNNKMQNYIKEKQELKRLEDMYLEMIKKRKAQMNYLSHWENKKKLIIKFCQIWSRRRKLQEENHILKIKLEIYKANMQHRFNKKPFQKKETLSFESPSSIVTQKAEGANVQKNYYFQKFGNTISNINKEKTSCGDNFDFDKSEKRDVIEETAQSTETFPKSWTKVVENSTLSKQPHLSSNVQNSQQKAKKVNDFSTFYFQETGEIISSMKPHLKKVVKMDEFKASKSLSDPCVEKNAYKFQKNCSANNTVFFENTEKYWSQPQGKTMLSDGKSSYDVKDYGDISTNLIPKGKVKIHRPWSSPSDCTKSDNNEIEIDKVLNSTKDACKNVFAAANTNEKTEMINEKKTQKDFQEDMDTSLPYKSTKEQKSEIEKRRNNVVNDKSSSSQFMEVDNQNSRIKMEKSGFYISKKVPTIKSSYLQMDVTSGSKKIDKKINLKENNLINLNLLHNKKDRINNYESLFGSTTNKTKYIPKTIVYEEDKMDNNKQIIVNSNRKSNKGIEEQESEIEKRQYNNVIEEIPRPVLMEVDNQNLDKENTGFKISQEPPTMKDSNLQKNFSPDSKIINRKSNLKEENLKKLNLLHNEQDGNNFETLFGSTTNRTKYIPKTILHEEGKMENNKQVMASLNRKSKKIIQEQESEIEKRQYNDVIEEIPKPVLMEVDNQSLEKENIGFKILQKAPTIKDNNLQKNFSPHGKIFNIKSNLKEENLKKTNMLHNERDVINNYESLFGSATNGTKYISKTTLHEEGKIENNKQVMASSNRKIKKAIEEQENELEKRRYNDITEEIPTPEFMEVDNQILNLEKEKNGFKILQKAQTFKASNLQKNDSPGSKIINRKSNLKDNLKNLDLLHNEQDEINYEKSLEAASNRLKYNPNTALNEEENMENDNQLMASSNRKNNPPMHANLDKSHYQYNIFDGANYDHEYLDNISLEQETNANGFNTSDGKIKCDKKNFQRSKIFELEQENDMSKALGQSDREKIHSLENDEPANIIALIQQDKTDSEKVIEETDQHKNDNKIDRENDQSDLHGEKRYCFERDDRNNIIAQNIKKGIRLFDIPENDELNVSNYVNHSPSKYNLSFENDVDEALIRQKETDSELNFETNEFGCDLELIDSTKKFLLENGIDLDKSFTSDYENKNENLKDMDNEECELNSDLTAKGVEGASAFGKESPPTVMDYKQDSGSGLNFFDNSNFGSIFGGNMLQSNSTGTNALSIFSQPENDEKVSPERAKKNEEFTLNFGNNGDFLTSSFETSGFKLFS